MSLPPAIAMYGAQVQGVVPSAAYTAAPASQDYQDFRGVAGLAVTLSVTAPASGTSVGVNILAVDETSGATWPVATVVPLTGTGQTTVRIHPNNPTAPVAAGVQTQQGQIPPRLRIQVVQTGGVSTTYSVGMDCTY